MQPMKTPQYAQLLISCISSSSSFNQTKPTPLFLHSTISSIPSPFTSSVEGKKPEMATNSLQSLHHHSPLLPNRHTTIPSSLRLLNPSSSSSSTISSPTPSLSSSTTTATFSISPTTSAAASTSQSLVFYEHLQHLLSTRNFFQADEETRRILIVLAGEPARKRGYVFFSEAQFIPQSDLKAIDCLWRQYSNGRFGYSVQRRIWKKVNRDFTRFFLKVGWMKKLDTEVEQYNYRAFPTEFTWELKDDDPTSPPEGHLPLTNALRGTQLLSSILSHPAFEEEEAAAAIEEGEVEEKEEKQRQLLMGSKSLSSNRIFKTDYSF